MNLVWLDMFFVFISSLPISFVFPKILVPKLNGAVTSLIFAGGLTFMNFIFNFYSGLEILIPDYTLRMNIKMFTIPILWLLYFIFFFNEPLKKRLFTFLTMSVVNFLGELLAGFIISSVIKDVNSSTVRDLPWDKKIIYYVVAIIVYAISAVAIYLICNRKQLNIPPSLIVTYGAIIFINIFIFLVIINSQSFTNDIITRITLLVAPISLVILFITLYKIMKKLNDQEIIKEKLYWLENVKALELDYYNTLQQKSEEVRRFRHDFKDTLETLKLLVNENTPESINKAQDILKSLNQNISNTKLPVYTSNVVINSVVGTKVDEAKKDNIIVHAALDLPKDLRIESIDLNCVFLNLLNNAIEACEKIPDITNREITLKSAVKAGYLIIKTENPFVDIEEDEKGNLKTTKEDKENHGIGLSLISSIAEKYDGSFETKTENNIFTAIVNLKL